MENKKLTLWEIGQEITKANDALLAVITELEGYEDLQEDVKRARAIIVKSFYEAGLNYEMGFGI